MNRFLRLLCLMLIFLFLPGCATALNNVPKAKEGVLDISGWDFSKKGSVRLDGMWEFFWNDFVTPDKAAKKLDAYIKVPGIWKETIIGTEKLSGTGYCTYRLNVKSSLTKNTMLGLRLFTFSSAYRLYINGELVAQNGVPAALMQEETANYSPQTVYFRIPEKNFNITVHVSNHSYARGGFWYSAFLGTNEQMAAMHDSIMQREAFLFGALVIVIMFFLAIYIMRRELQYLLVFCCFCVVMLIALNMVGQLSLLRFISMPFETLVFIWYSSVAWTFFLLYYYIHMLYKSNLSNLFLKAFFIITLAQQITYICTPVLFYSENLAAATSVINVVFLAGTVFIIINAIIKRQDDGWLNLCGLIIGAAAYVHDDMYWMNIINPAYGELHHLGLLIFLFIQMVLQAKRIRRYYDDMAAAEIAFSHAQIKPHFLFNTLNTIISVSHFDGEKSRELLTNFARYLRGSFDIKGISHVVSLEREIELTKAYVTIEQARFEERIKVYYDIDAHLSVKVPLLMLQPIVENAIHHGLLPKNEGGCVNVIIKQQGGSINFCVEDNGVGIDKSILDAVLSGSRGIALYNINKRLIKMFGKGISFSGTIGCGTKVAWSIPIKRKGEKGDKGGSY